MVSAVPEINHMILQMRRMYDARHSVPHMLEPLLVKLMPKVMRVTARRIKDASHCTAGRKAGRSVTATQINAFHTPTHSFNYLRPPQHPQTTGKPDSQSRFRPMQSGYQPPRLYCTITIAHRARWSFVDCGCIPARDPLTLFCRSGRKLGWGNWGLGFVRSSCSIGVAFKKKMRRWA